MIALKVDWDACICAGMCTSVAPALFDLDDTGELVLVAGELVGDEYTELAHGAAGVCPVEAITVEQRS